jgi:hypothetical protein
MYGFHLRRQLLSRTVMRHGCIESAPAYEVCRVIS